MSNAAQSSYTASLLAYYNLASAESIVQIMFDEQGSQGFHLAGQKGKALLLQTVVLSKQQMRFALQNSYSTICKFYSQADHLFEEAKLVISYKHEHSQIIKAHNARKSVWLLLSGAQHRILQCPSAYEQLKGIEYPEFYKKVIQADVHRTLEQRLEDSDILLDTLNNVLRTLAKRNPYVGYCQGMNFVANFLATMQFEEEEMFWLLSSLIEDILPHSYYSSMMGVAVDLKILEHYLQIFRPQIYEKLLTLQVDVSIICLEWLVCVFTTTLPFCLLTIVWDLLLLQGSSVLLKVAVVLLDELAGDIFQAQDFASLLAILDKRKKKYSIKQDAFLAKVRVIFLDRRLLEIARNIYGHLLLEIDLQKSSPIKKKKAEAVACNLDWPICYEMLRKSKNEQSDIEIWTFREHGLLKPIQDYLEAKNKSGFKNYDEIRTGQKQLLMGRMAHVCSGRQLRAGEGIELCELVGGGKSFEEGGLKINSAFLNWWRR